MSEELFNSEEEYLRFMRNNCEQCKFGSTIEYDYGDGENKTVYHCKTQKEIDDCLCEGKEPSQKTIIICDYYFKQGENCPDQIQKK